MNVEAYIEHLKSSPSFMKNVTSWRVLPARKAKYADFPAGLDARLVAALARRGIERPYIHQRLAMEAALAGEDCVVVTPTASGKTLCYNVPVLNAILQNEADRALYIFPTKALSSDQAAELYSLIEDMGAEVKAYTYDGDTPASARTAIRQAGHVVVTNPDMLHQGILPHHAKWVKLFENLRYVVIDEIHAYRGVFGSNLANVIRRLKRVCAFYGSHPTFICCSATIANPGELAEAMIGRPVRLIDENGAPAGERHVVFYDPPVVNRQLGIRAGSIPETRNIAAGLLRAGVQSIVFARARLTVEVLVRYLKDMVRDPLGNAGRVRGYRGGYLPTQRREIERELRAGNILTVVSTNALELGIDIGQLDACVLCGYPGTIASTWQQAGRAGRRGGKSLMILVASSSPLDQYIVNHPDYFFFEQFVHPPQPQASNCPEDGELFDGVHDTAEFAILRHGRTLPGWRRSFPGGHQFALGRPELPHRFTDPKKAPRHRRDVHRADALHQYAIYMHEGDQYQVEQLFDDKKASCAASTSATTPTPTSPPAKSAGRVRPRAHRLFDAHAGGAGQLRRTL